MNHITTHDLDKLQSRQRANLINSCSGYRSATLIATKSKDGIENVAVFNSVAHVGSNPAMLSFLLRPTTVERHTYENIKETNYLTVNHIHSKIIAQAHQTSAKYKRTTSEFEAADLKPEYKDNFFAPYVKESKIKLGCHYINEYKIEENGCILVLIGIDHIFYDANLQEADGTLNLERADEVAITGLDSYSSGSLLKRFEYAKPELQPTSK